MIGEIIAIGDELISGRIANSNSSYVADQLFRAGHEIGAIITIGDSPAIIGATLKKSLQTADFLIVTGGLGATSDDLTTEAVIEALDRPGVIDHDLLEKLSLRWNGNADRRRQAMEKLARLPAGAEVLSPDAAMAGYLLVSGNTPVFFLPGIPHEMKELMATQVIPRLSTWPNSSSRQVTQKIYKVFGLPETEINHRLNRLETSDQRLHLGYYPSFPEVHLSLTILTDGEEAATALFRTADREIRSTLDSHLFGQDEETMAEVVGKLLKEQAKTLAVAESCSGGLIAHQITEIAGSSEYFTGGVVAYSNTLKEELLGVKNGLLAQHGAVSALTARAMAEGVRARSGADIAVAVTGIAGPSGGSLEKPVGTVFFGLATAKGTLDLLFHFHGNRQQIQELTAVTALDLVRRLLLDKPLRETGNSVTD